MTSSNASETSPLAVVVAADLPAGTTIYDPGLERTAFARSAITHVDPSAGRLTYRGVNTIELADAASFASVARLLLGSKAVPDDRAWSGLALLAAGDVSGMQLPKPPGERPMWSPINYVAAGLAFAAATAGPDTIHEASAARLICLVRSLVGLTLGRHDVEDHRNADDPFGLAFLLADGGEVPADRLRALNAVLILYADHEMAASTTALRVAASAGAGLLAAASVAAATFGGARHGGASEAVGALFERLPDVAAVDAEMERVHRKETRLPGFGHRMHRGHDPRVVAIKAMIATLPDSSRSSTFQVAAHLEQRAAEDPFMRERKLFPNPDFYAVQLLMALGFPAESSSAVLAVGRSAGWAAHWSEAVRDPDSRLIRPRQLYTGR